MSVSLILPAEVQKQELKVSKLTSMGLLTLTSIFTSVLIKTSLILCMAAETQQAVAESKKSS